MELEWSISDPEKGEKGARTVQEIKEKCKLSKRKFNCPLFPMKRVVIDTLHLFLCVTNVLINLLIRDL